MLDIIYITTMAGLSLLGFHRFYLLMWALIDARSQTDGLSRTEIETHSTLPHVTIQLPIFNEKHVVSRLIEAVCTLDYDLTKLNIQVLDDSTDDTGVHVDRAVQYWAGRGRSIKVIRRKHRHGFKAGALEEGMTHSSDPFIAIFDADFIPEASFLKRALAEFTEQNIGMVQARWSHYNRHASLLTEAQAILLDGHFAIEQRARWASGAWFNFNGTAGVWRRNCILDAGGWAHETLTEDLDLSYRAQMKGWSFKYVNQLTVPSELPTSLSAFRSQQHRWAKGSIQVAQKLLLKIIHGPYSIREKWESACHLLANLNYLLVSMLSVCIPLLVFNETQGVLFSEFGHLFFGLGAACFGMFYVGSQIRQQRLFRACLLLPIVFATGIGLCINNTKAVLEAFCGHISPFIRTPKTGMVHDTPQSGTSYTIPTGKIIHVIEYSFLCVYIACLGICIKQEQWRHLPLIILFCAAFATPLWAQAQMLNPTGQRSRTTP
ncbi:MAG: glycosyltransferase [Bradymonadia bacterium]